MPLCHDDFVDVSEGKIVFENPENTNKKSNHLPFKKAIWFQYRTTDPDAVFVRLEYAEDAPFIKYVAKVNKNKRGRPSNNSEIKPYKSRFPITPKKFKDLQKLCTDLEIPRIYHDFYNNLPSEDSVRDALPEPDESEESDSTE